MEFFGAQITSTREERRWDKIKASRNGPCFSHIFFTNDLTLFAKAYDKNCEAIMEVLDNFYSLVGQKLNHGKSRIYFSPNVTRRCKRNICKEMGINAINNLDRYLGFPIIHQGRFDNAFNFVLEKFQAKLAS